MYSPTLYLPTFLPKQKASALLHLHILKHYYNLVFLFLKAEFHFNMSTSPAYTLEFESSQCNIAQNIFLNLLKIVIEMTHFSQCPQRRVP